MPRKILATVIEVYCPSCGKAINIRSEEGESEHTISCWSCDTSITVQNGYGVNNLRVFSGDERLRYIIIWQQKP